MKVSKNWISEHLDIKNLTDEEFAKIINAHVCEIETYTKLVEASNMTIGLVHECVDHPDSDHLHICQVELKDGEVSQIVCGAPNVRAGVKVLVAVSKPNEHSISSFFKSPSIVFGQPIT